MLDFKFTILTPWTLLSTDLADELCADEPADEFARILCERTLHELERYSFWPRARGEAFIQRSFDSFEERFLKQSEYAVIVLSGQHASRLDNIYPRFLVFLTRRPSWRKRMLLVFLGSPKDSFRFDTKILTHEPIIFHGSVEEAWESDEESWDKLLGVLRKNYLPHSMENSRNQSRSHTPMSRDPKWVSITDLRGRPLAVKITERMNHVHSIPSSWQNLTQTDRDISTNQYTVRSANGRYVPLSQFSSRVTRSSQRNRAGSEPWIPFDVSLERSSSVPPVRGGLNLSDYPHGSFDHWTANTTHFSPFLRSSAESNYLTQHYHLESEDHSVIKEQDEEQGLDSTNSALATTETNYPQSEGAEQLMCLPKNAFSIRGTNQSHGKRGQTSTNASTDAAVAGQSITRNRSFSGWMRFGQRHVQSSHDISTDYPDELEHKPMFKRLKKRAYSLWKPHSGSEKFGSRTRNALGGTLKSLAGFSTGITGLDPALDPRTTEKTQARSCPNIHNARSPTFQSQVPYLSPSEDFTGSLDAVHSFYNSSIVHKRSHTSHLVGDYSTRTSFMSQEEKVIVQKSSEHAIPATTFIRTKLKMDRSHEKCNLSYSLPTHPDSGQRSVSPRSNESNASLKLLKGDICSEKDSSQHADVKFVSLIDNHLDGSELLTDNGQKHALREKNTSTLPATDFSSKQYSPNTKECDLRASVKPELSEFTSSEVDSTVLQQECETNAVSEQEEKRTVSIVERTDMGKSMQLHDEQNLSEASDTQLNHLHIQDDNKSLKQNIFGPNVDAIPPVTIASANGVTTELQLSSKYGRDENHAESNYPKSLSLDIENAVNESNDQAIISHIPPDVTQLGCRSESTTRSSAKDTMTSTIAEPSDLQSVLETDLDADMFHEPYSTALTLTSTPNSGEVTANLRSCTVLDSRSFQPVDESRYSGLISENFNMDVNDTEGSLAGVPEIVSIVTSKEQKQPNSTDPISDIVSDISSDWTETRMEVKPFFSDMESTDHKPNHQSCGIYQNAESTTVALSSQLDSGVDGESIETVYENIENVVENSDVFPYVEPVVLREHTPLVDSQVPIDHSLGQSKQEHCRSECAIELSSCVCAQDGSSDLNTDVEALNKCTADSYKQNDRRELQASGLIPLDSSVLCSIESSEDHTTDTQTYGYKVEQKEPLQYETSANELPNTTLRTADDVESWNESPDEVKGHQSNGGEQVESDVTGGVQPEPYKPFGEYTKLESNKPVLVANMPQKELSVSSSIQEQTILGVMGTSSDSDHLADVNKSVAMTSDKLNGGSVYETLSTATISSIHDSSSKQEIVVSELSTHQNLEENQTNIDEMQKKLTENVAFEHINVVSAKQLGAQPDTLQTVASIDSEDQKNTLLHELDNDLVEKIDGTHSSEIEGNGITHKTPLTELSSGSMSSATVLSEVQVASPQLIGTIDENITQAKGDTDNRSWTGWLSRKIFGSSNPVTQNIKSKDETKYDSLQGDKNVTSRKNDDNDDSVNVCNRYEQEEVGMPGNNKQDSKTPFYVIAPLTQIEGGTHKTSSFSDITADNIVDSNSMGTDPNSQPTVLTQNQTTINVPVRVDSDGLDPHQTCTGFSGLKSETPEARLVCGDKSSIYSSMLLEEKVEPSDHTPQLAIQPTRIEKREVDNRESIQPDFELKSDVNAVEKYPNKSVFENLDHPIKQNSTTVERHVTDSSNVFGEQTMQGGIASNQEHPTGLDDLVARSHSNEVTASIEPSVKSMHQNASKRSAHLDPELTKDVSIESSLQDTEDVTKSEQKKISVQRPKEHTKWKDGRYSEPVSNDQLATAESSTVGYRPSERNLLFIDSIFHFVTIYIPRHIYWFYLATFHSRERLYEVMADRGLQVAIRWDRITTGLRNPYCATIILLGVTSTAPIWSQWPELVRRGIRLADWYLFTPLFWVDRPILYHLGHLFHSVHNSVSYRGQTVITSFHQYPWSLINPVE